MSGIFFYDVTKQEGNRNIVLEDDVVKLIDIIKCLVNKHKITDVKQENGKKGYYSRFIDYKDIMILTLTKKNLTAIAKMLTEAGIPVKVTGGNIVEKAPSFLILANIIKMLAYPEENAYLHRVLTDVPFYFSKKEIVDFVNNGGMFNIYFNFDEYYKKNNLTDEVNVLFKKFEKAFHTIKQWIYYSKHIPVASLVLGIIEEIGLQRKMLNSTEISSFTSLIEQIKMNDISDIWGVDKLSDCIKEMIENGAEEENDIEGEDYNAVRLMNLHKSKGLEAPIVILAGPKESGNDFQSLYIERTVDENGNNLYKGHVRLVMNPGKTMPRYGEHMLSGEWESIEPLADYKADLERDRALYVAATRAKNILIISRIEKNGAWEKLTNLLDETCENVLPYIIFSKKDVSTEISEELFPVDVLTEIAKINDKRNNFFDNNVATFSNVMASEANKNDFLAEVSEEIMGNIDELVNKNSIKIKVNFNEKTEVVNMQLGTIVHKLFETEIKEPDNMEYVINEILDNTQLYELTFDILQGIVEKFRKSEIYERIKKSEKAYTEVPISVKDENNVYTTGIIDLIFKENDNWVIVDYKTCDKSHSKVDLYKKYMAQIGIYKTAWEKVTGSSGTKIELCFVEK